MALIAAHDRVRLGAASTAPTVIIDTVRRLFEDADELLTGAAAHAEVGHYVDGQAYGAIRRVDAALVVIELACVELRRAARAMRRRVGVSKVSAA